MRNQVKVGRLLSDILLNRYETAMRIFQEVITAMQTGSWEEALVLYTSAKSNWQNLKQTYDLRLELQNCLLFLASSSSPVYLMAEAYEPVFVYSWQEQLPVFLRCFTIGWAYTRILSRGVEILQRLRRYEVCVRAGVCVFIVLKAIRKEN